MRLPELQGAIRDALVLGRTDGLVGELVGGANPAGRLAVHQRHYRTSLVRALLARFPAICWLLGGQRARDAATAYLEASPPHAPCLAEYGGTFPEFLAGWLKGRLGFAADFARLELAVGAVALAIDRPPAAAEALTGFAESDLPELRLPLQPGLRFLAAEWPVDTLFRVFTVGKEPERMHLDPTPCHLQIRGARGTCEVVRLDPAEWRFRHALARGGTLGAAIDAAAADDFDASTALGRLFAAGLVTAIEAGA